MNHITALKKKTKKTILSASQKILKAAKNKAEKTLDKINLAIFMETEENHILRDLMKSIIESEKAGEEKSEQALDQAHESAEAGTGPQPYDRDWIEADLDFDRWIIEESKGLNWHITNDLIEVIDWALQSPQGTKALDLQDSENSPWQDPLENAIKLKLALEGRAQMLLEEQAKKLNWTKNYRLMEANR